ncbi:MAG: biotin--[acetyl-CoA-carboxylase] ligase [Vibrionaceae bacterium]
MHGLINNAYTLVTKLQDGEWHTLQNIGLALEDVLQIEQQFDEWGLTLECKSSLPNLTCVRLSKAVSLLDESALQKLWHWPVFFFAQIGSTNQYLLGNINSLSTGSVCLTERQTAGRGQNGRVWHSPFASNLYLSLLWRIDTDPCGVTLALGVTLAKALAKLGCQKMSVKWPNDLYCDGKKVAGILVESSAQVGSPVINLVIGLGINLTMDKSEGKSIEQAWSNLLDHLPSSALNKTELAFCLLQAMAEGLNKFAQTGLAGFMQDWQQFDYLQHQAVFVEQGGELLCGTARGISAQGALQLETPTGVLEISCGRVRLA